MESIILIAVAALLIFFMFRSNKKRRREQEQLQEQMVPGVEVMTSFGLFGTIVSVDEENATALLEVAPGTVVKVYRQTLARIVPVDEPVVEEATVVDDETEPRADKDNDK